MPVSAPLARHIQHMQQAPMLDADQERALAISAKSGNLAAREQLALAYAKYAISMARRAGGNNPRFEDLISIAYIGMMEAIDGFNPDLGLRLSTYMRFPIRHRLSQDLLASWSVVASFTNKAQQRLFFALLRDRESIDGPGLPDLRTLDRYARHFDLTRQEVEDTIDRVLRPDVSLSQPIGNDGMVVGDTLQDPTASPEVLVEEAQSRAKRRRLLDLGLGRLDDRTQAVVRARRLDDPPKTLGQIADQLGVSRERVRQIEARGIEVLTAWMVARP